MQIETKQLSTVYNTNVSNTFFGGRCGIDTWWNDGNLL